MKFAKKTKSYKLLPVTWLNDFESLLAFVLGPKIKRKVNLYRKYLSVRDENYLKWAIKEMINWKQEDPMDDHGDGQEDLDDDHKDEQEDPTKEHKDWKKDQFDSFSSFNIFSLVDDEETIVNNFGNESKVFQIICC